MNASNVKIERWDVFSISPATSDGGKPWWTKVGAAFRNRDGSINVRLRALPLNGELQLRIPEERDQGASNQRGGSDDNGPY